MEWTSNGGTIIGRGATAVVSVATAVSSGEKVAVKSTELAKSDVLRREAKILSSLNSPRIISYRGSRETEENFELSMELADGGSLSDEIRRRGGSLSDAAARVCAREILLGLHYLHSEGFVHCDIKPPNVLVTREGLKIADFGCAKRHVDGADLSPLGFCGTPAYVAPEVARGEGQGFAADVWAFGCTVVEMFTGRVSWIAGSDPVSALYRVGFSGIEVELPGCVSELGRDFLGKCLKREAGERWTVKELLEHPFVAGNFGSGFEMGSPRSVLETGLVDVDLRESSTSGSGSGSGWERVRGLCCGDATSFWASEEGWVTVRGIWAEEEEGPNGLSCVSEIDWACDSEPMSSIGFEDGLRYCSCVSDWERGSSVMTSKCTKGHVLCDCLYFEFNELYCLLCIPRSLFFYSIVVASLC